MNPNDMPEVCECGGEESDHYIQPNPIPCNCIDGVSECYFPECLSETKCKHCDQCDKWRPKDDQFYVEREFDAMAEKYDRGRE